MCWLCEQRWQQVCSVLQQLSAVLEQVRHGGDVAAKAYLGRPPIMLITGGTGLCSCCLACSCAVRSLLLCLQENPDLFKWLTGQQDAPQEMQQNPAFQVRRHPAVASTV
jgi:hypothetical protein